MPRTRPDGSGRECRIRIFIEAGAGAVESFLSGRIFINERGTKTGLALVNANPATATVLLCCADSGTPNQLAIAR